MKPKVTLEFNEYSEIVITPDTITFEDDTKSLKREESTKIIEVIIRTRYID